MVITREKGHAKNNNYLFIGFPGEEMGLLGSKKYVENPTIDPSKVNYTINMDMIGRLNEEKDICDYIEGLGKYKKGDTTTVVVLRSKEKKSLQVTF